MPIAWNFFLQKFSPSGMHTSLKTPFCSLPDQFQLPDYFVSRVSGALFKSDDTPH